MDVVCAWCKKELGKKEPLSDKSISHGICKPCSKKFLGIDLDAAKEKSMNKNPKLTVIILKDSSTGEYRVPGPDGSEAQAYYTDDKDDAIGTAKLMYKGQDLRIVYNTLSNFDKFLNENPKLKTFDVWFQDKKTGKKDVIKVKAPTYNEAKGMFYDALSVTQQKRYSVIEVSKSINRKHVKKNPGTVWVIGARRRSDGKESHLKKDGKILEFTSKEEADKFANEARNYIGYAAHYWVEERHTNRKNPGANWHTHQAVAARERVKLAREASNEKQATFEEGMQYAHELSTAKSEQLGVNPKKFIDGYSVYTVVNTKKDALNEGVKAKKAGWKLVFIKYDKEYKQYYVLVSTKKNPGAAWHEKRATEYKKDVDRLKRTGMSDTYGYADKEARYLEQKYSAAKSHELGINPIERRYDDVEYTAVELAIQGHTINDIESLLQQEFNVEKSIAKYYAKRAMQIYYGKIKLVSSKIASLLKTIK